MYHNSTTHRIVTLTAHLITGDFVYKVWIIRILLHVSSTITWCEPDSSCNTGNRIHFETEVRQSYVMDNVTGTNDHLYRTSFNQVYFTIFKDHIIQISLFIP